MKKYILYGFAFLIFLAFVFSSYTKTYKETIPLFIPDEMHFVIPKLIEIYTREHSNVEVLIQETSSSEFDALPKKGIHIFDSWENPNVKPFLSSPLVVIGHRKIYSLDQLKASSILIPDPDYSITGVNSIKMLRAEKLWDTLKRSISYKQKGILCMESVDLGEEDYAIITLADGLFVKNALIVFSLKNKANFSVQYGIKNYDTTKETQKHFYEFLRSEEAIKIFEKYGFSLPIEEDLSKSVK